MIRGFTIFVLLAVMLSSVLPAYWAFATLPNNPDVVIIGAGMAGLSAAKALMADGSR